MIIKININPFLTHTINNQGIIEVSENKIVQFIQQSVARFPELRKSLFGKDKKVERLC
jgi:hypothetical protein